MKITIFSAVIFMFVFIFFGGGLAKADEIAELKAQIKALQASIGTLNSKVTALEEKQKAQEERAVEIPKIASSVEKIQEKPSELFEGVHVGGHLKFYMFDQTNGKRNDKRQHNNISAGIHDVYLYLTKELEDWLSLDIQTETSVTASATPSLGSDISRASSGSVSTSIYQVYITARLPKEVELRFGLIYPHFSDEYARETWWDELYHQNKGLDYLQSVRDTGIALYKSFDFKNWSLPAYLYYLNGNTSSQYVDNNEGKTVLIHLAPEFFQTKFRLLGSFAYGKWDDENKYDLIRGAGGFDWKYQKFNLVSEYLYSKWENLSLTGSIGIGKGREDGTRDGYYVKALYRFTPKWRGLVKYSHAELYNTGDTTTIRSDIYDVLTFGVNYFITPSSTLIGQLSMCDADRSDDSEALEFLRYTLGWRTTF